MATIEVNSQNFQEIVNKEGIVVLDFWAEWCGPCKAFGPVFEAASEAHPTHTWGKLNTEANQDVSHALQVQSIPTVMMFRDGILLFRQAGALPQEALDDLIAQAEALNMEEVRAQIEQQQ